MTMKIIRTWYGSKQYLRDRDGSIYICERKIGRGKYSEVF